MGPAQELLVNLLFAAVQMGEYETARAITEALIQAHRELTNEGLERGYHGNA